MPARQTHPAERGRSSTVRTVLLGGVMAACVIAGLLLVVSRGDKPPIRDAEALGRLCQSGLDEMAAGRPEAALRLFDAVLREDPDSVPVLVNRSWALNRLRRHTRAINDADRALELDPDCTPAMIQRAAALLGSKQAAEALETIDEALRRDSGRAAAWVVKANALVALGEDCWPDARSCYDKALAIASDLVEARVGKGWLLNRMGEYDAAMACHRRAVAHARRDADVWRIGIYAVMQKDPQAAPVEMIEEAIALVPGNAALWSDKGLALYRHGRHDRALDCVDAALRLDSGLVAAWNNKALVLEALGDQSGALRALDRALLLEPGYGPAIENSRRLRALQTPQPGPQ